jgi:hypothetical protein
MLSTQEITVSYIFGLLLLMVFFAISRGARGITGYRSTFKNTVIAVLALTTTYALVVSQFHSYLLILAGLLIYGLVRKYRLEKETKASLYMGEEVKSALFPESLLLLGYFTFSFIVLNLKLWVEPGPYSNLHPDFAFYAGISEILANTGIENRLMDIALADKRSFTFYHYFELWWNGWMSELLGHTYLRTLMLVTIPLGSAIMLKGVQELTASWLKAKDIKRGAVYILPLAILFLFPYTLTLRWLLSLGSAFTPWNPSIASSTMFKWIIVLSGLVFLVLDYKKHKNQNIALILAFLGVVYPSTIIAIVPSLVLWAFIFRKNLPKWTLIDTGVSVVLILVGYAFVNRLGSGVNPEYTKNIPGTVDLIKSYFLETPKNVVLFVKEPILRTGYILFAFAPLLLLAIPYYQKGVSFFKEKKELILFFAIAYVLSVGGVVLLDFSYDGDQLHRNLFYPLYILLLYGGLLTFSISSKIQWVKKGTMALFIGTVALNVSGITLDALELAQQKPNGTKQEVETIIETIQNDPGGIVFIADSSYFHNTRRKNFYFVIPGQNLRLQLHDYYTTCLSIDRIELEGGDLFNLGSTLMSGHFYEPVYLEDQEYQDIFKTSSKWKYLIVDENAPELKAAETDFGVKYMGKIENFNYYSKR